MSNVAITGVVSASINNSRPVEQLRHTLLWLDYVEKIRQLATNPKYREIELQVSADEEVKWEPQSQQT